MNVCTRFRCNNLSKLKQSTENTRLIFQLEFSYTELHIKGEKTKKDDEEIVNR